MPKAPEFDAVALQARVDAVIEADVAYRAKRDASIKARLLANAADCAERAAPIRSALLGIVVEHLWQLGRHLADARALLAVPDWDVPLIRTGRRYLLNAEGNATRALERLSRPRLPQWYMRAESRDVCLAAHSACIILSDLDMDWASTKNREG